MQQLSIYLTPDFYVELPMSWLSVFEWVNFFSFDIGLALDMPSLNGTSLAFSLMTQPLLIFWFWAVEGDRLKERIEKIKFKPGEWLTKDEDKRAEWERFNLEISDGSLQEWEFDVKPFVILFGIFPTVVLLGVALPISFAIGPNSVASILFVITMLVFSHGCVMARCFVYTRYKRMCDTRFPDENNDETFTTTVKAGELSLVLLGFQAAYVSPIMGLLTAFKESGGLSAVVLVLLLCVYVLAPPALLARVAWQLAREARVLDDGTSLRDSVVADPDNWGKRVAQTAAHAKLEYNVLHVMKKQGVAISKSAGGAPIPGATLACGARLGYSHEVEINGIKHFKLVDGRGFVAAKENEDTTEIDVAGDTILSVGVLTVKNPDGMGVLSAIPEPTPQGGTAGGGKKVPTIKMPPDDDLVMRVEPKGRKLNFTFQTSRRSTFVYEKVRGSGKKFYRNVNLYKLTDGCWLHDFTDGETEAEHDATKPEVSSEPAKATGAGRAALLKLVAPYECKFWWITCALMLEKAISAVLVVGIGSEKKWVVWAGAFFMLQGLGFSAYVAPYVEDAQDSLDKLQRLSGVIFNSTGAMLQVEAFGKSAGRHIGAAILFVNSAWTFVTMMTAIDPVGIYRQFLDSMKRSMTAMQFGNLDENEVEKKLSHVVVENRDDRIRLEVTDDLTVTSIEGKRDDERVGMKLYEVKVNYAVEEHKGDSVITKEFRVADKAHADQLMSISKVKGHVASVKLIATAESRKPFLDSLDALAVSTLSDAQIALIMQHGGDSVIKCEALWERAMEIGPQALARICKGNTDQVLREFVTDALERGKNTDLDLNAKPQVDYESQTALMIAAKGLRVEHVRFLIKQSGVDRTLKGENDQNLIHMAAQATGDELYQDSSQPPRLLEMLRVLVDEAGLDPAESSKCGSAKQRKNALHYLAENTTIGEDAQNPDAHNEVLLEVVRWLVQRGKVRIEEKEEEDRTVLLMFCDNCDGGRGFPVVRFLIEECRANVSAKKEEGLNALMCVCAASESTSMETLRYLVEKCGLKPDSTDDNGCLPLHHLIMGGGTKEALWYLLDRAPETLNTQAEVNGNEDFTPIMTAIDFGAEHLIEALLARGADLSIKDGQGNTPIHTLCSNKADDADACIPLLKKLIASGVDMNEENDEGKTALDILKDEAKGMTKREFPGYYQCIEFVQSHGGKAGGGKADDDENEDDEDKDDDEGNDGADDSDGSFEDVGDDDEDDDVDVEGDDASDEDDDDGDD